MKKKEIRYDLVHRQWNNFFTKDKFLYGDGYNIKNETFARLRFHSEISTLRRILHKYKISLGSFLDVGCGNGKFIFSLAKKFSYLVGVDFSQQSISIAKKEATRRKVRNVFFYCRDIKKINLRKKFDVIFVGGVLMYINDEDIPQVLRILQKHLQDKGIIIIREPFFDTRKSIVKNVGYQVIYRSLSKIKNFLYGEDLKVLEQKLNPGYIYGVILDFYIHLLPKIIKQERLPSWIIYKIMVKRWFLHINYMLLHRFVKCKGYFLIVQKKSILG